MIDIRISGLGHCEVLDCPFPMDSWSIYCEAHAADIDHMNNLIDRSMLAFMVY